MSNKTKCACACTDPGCPYCAGECTQPAKTVVVRIDMEDRTGTPMCLACADDALACGVFDERKDYLRRYWAHRIAATPTPAARDGGAA
jgi:hypothetical protein